MAPKRGKNRFSMSPRSIVEAFKSSQISFPQFLASSVCLHWLLIIAEITYFPVKRQIYISLGVGMEFGRVQIIKIPGF